MKSQLLPATFAAACLLTPLVRADVFINELRIDEPGADQFEYVELYNDDGANPVDLTGYSLLVIGDGSGGSGTIESVVDLTGFSVPTAGYLVVGKTGATQDPMLFDYEDDATVDLSTPLDAALGLNFENSDNVTHLLVTGFTGSNGDDLDTDNDGTLDVTPWTGVTDAIGLVETVGSGDLNYGAALGFTDIGPNGANVPAHVYRAPDGGTWNIGAYGSQASDPDPLTGSNDTPGVANPTGGGPLTLSLDTASISEDGSTTINATVSTAAPVSGDLTVTVTISDETEASSFDTTIFDTETEGSFTISAVDDFWPDGDQPVTVTVSAPTYDPDDETFTVTDDDTGFLLLVNEVYYAADASLLDANNDGTADTSEPSDDEFIEIVNTSGGPLDLSGVEIWTAWTGAPAHVFPAGTRLGTDCSILVFGGGDFPEGSSSGSFGTAEAQKSSEGGLWLEDDGSEFLRLVDTNGALSGTAGAELQTLALPDQTASPTGGSYALQTDATYSSGYALHTAIPAASGTNFSPGTMLDGSAFCTLSGQLTVTFNVSEVSEGDIFVAAGGTVSAPAPVSGNLTVYLSSSDSGELDAESTSPVTIPDGQSSTNFDLFPVDELDLDGTQSVTITARASGYLNGSNAIDVTDDDDTPYTPPNLIITEIMYNPNSDESAPGVAEWVEIYNADSVAADLAGIRLDDEDTNDWGAIGGGSLDPGKFLVLFDASFTDASTFRSEWSVPADALLIGVSWGNLSNSPSSGNEILQLLDPFDNLLDEVNFDDTSPWPADNNAASIALNTGAFDEVSNDDGANWLRSGDPGQSNAVGPSGPTFSTSDIGSPGFDGTGTAANTFAGWLSDNSYAATGFNDDDDLDGDTAGVEWYFFDSDPGAPSNNGSPIYQVSPAAGGSFTFTHRRPINATGVTAEYQYSHNLDGTWTPSNRTVTIHPDDENTTPDGDGYEIVTVTVTVTPTPFARVFVRLKLTEETPM